MWCFWTWLRLLYLLQEEQPIAYGAQGLLQSRIMLKLKKRCLLLQWGVGNLISIQVFIAAKPMLKQIANLYSPLPRSQFILHQNSYRECFYIYRDMILSWSTKEVKRWTLLMPYPRHIPPKVDEKSEFYHQVEDLIPLHTSTNNFVSRQPMTKVYKY